MYLVMVDKCGSTCLVKGRHIIMQLFQPFTQCNEVVYNYITMSCHLQSLLSDHAPSDLLQSLCDLTSEASGRVHAATRDVDLGRDAQLLRWVELTTVIPMTIECGTFPVSISL